MPSLRHIVFLFTCCSAIPLAAQESGRFVIPSDQPQMTFVPQAPPPMGQKNLQHLADSFGTQSPHQLRPAPIQLAAHTDCPDSAEPIRPAGMDRCDSASIQPAALLPIPARLPVEAEEEEDVEIVPPKKKSVLDTPLVRNSSLDGQGKIVKPMLSNGFGPVITMFASLFLVITTFLIFALLFKKVSPKGTRPLSKELFENLGRAPLTQKFQLHLLRLGNRLILVSVTPDGVQPITEISDPDEVVQLLGLCRRLDANSSTQNFKKMFNALAEEPTEGGYFGVDAGSRPKPKTKAAPRGKSSLVDLYSESDESLTELLANGLKGGRHG